MSDGCKFNSIINDIDINNEFYNPFQLEGKSLVRLNVRESQNP